MRKAVLIILCIFSLSSFTSCIGSKEIEDWVYVYSIGIDKGVSDKLRFTFQVPLVREEGEGGGMESSQSKDNTKITTITVDAPTFYAGVNMLNTSVNKTLNYMHAKFLVVGEDIARDGVERFFNSMVRSRQIRRSMHVIIVKGQASEFIKGYNPLFGSIIPRTQDNIMEQGKDTGFFEDVTYGDFLDTLKTYTSQPKASLAAINDFSKLKKKGSPQQGFKSAGDYYAGELPRTGGNKFEFMGTALFNGDKMVGELNGDETRAMKMLSGKLQNASIVVQDPKDPELRISAEVKQQKSPDIKISFQGGKPVIDAKVYLEGDLQNLQSTTNYESVELKPVLENKFRTFIKSELDKTVDKCQKLNCDAFDFGKKAVRQFLTIQDWEKYNWLSHFKDAKVTTHVEFTIRRTGKMTQTNPSITTEGEK